MQDPMKPFHLLLYTCLGKVFFMVLTVTLWLAHSDPALAYPTTPLMNFLNQSQTDNKRNHQLCFAYEDHSPGLPCNPAFLGIQRESTPWIYWYGNNNLQFFQDVADIVHGPIKARELLAIINHNSNDNFQTEISFGYLANNWGVNFIPDKLVLFTTFRNPALPRISVYAAREREIQFQLGSFFDKEWAWGVQFRGLQRRFIYSDAYFSDHLTDDIDFLYAIKTQNAFFVEPSLVYTPTATDWNPIISLMLTNLGKPNTEWEPFYYGPSGRLSVSVSDHLSHGLLKIGVTSQWLEQADRDKIYSGFGASYLYHHVELFTTLSELEQQVGIAFIDKDSGFTGAISYARQDWSATPSFQTHPVWRWDLGVEF